MCNIGLDVNTSHLSLFCIVDFDDNILGEQDVCQHEQAVGLNWKTTNAGSFDEIPCPKKAKGRGTNIDRDDNSCC